MEATDVKPSNAAPASPPRDGDAPRPTPVTPSTDAIEVIFVPPGEDFDWEEIERETTPRWEDWVESDPNVMFGKPVFKGTRLTVELVVENLAFGVTEAALLASYPRLRPEHIRAALAYAFGALRREAKAMLAARR